MRATPLDDRRHFYLATINVSQAEFGLPKCFPFAFMRTDQPHMIAVCAKPCITLPSFATGFTGVQRSSGNYVLRLQTEESVDWPSAKEQSPGHYRWLLIAYQQWLFNLFSIAQS